MLWKIYTLQKLGVYVLVGTSLAALWLGGAFIPAVWLVCGMAIIASWFCEPPLIDPSVYANLWRPLTLTVLGLLILAALLGYIGPFDAAIGLVLYLTAAKLFQRERAADYIQAMVLSFLLMSISTIFNEDISFGFLFIIYVVVGLISLTLYHLRIQVETHTQLSPQTRIGTPFLLNLAGLAVLALTISLVFFFAFPRIGFGFLAQQSRTPEILTGFSEEVNLGSFGTVKSDPTVVMRVEFTGVRPQRPQSLYWHGLTYDAYDGSSWTRTLNRVELVPTSDQRSYPLPESALSPVVQALQQDPASTPIQQQIYLEPINSSTLFSLRPLIRLRLSNSTSGNRARGSRSLIGIRETGDVAHRMLERVAYQYEATSLVPTWSGPDLQQISHEQVLNSLTPEQRRAYLQLPEDLNPEVQELAVEITEGIEGDYDRVMAVRDYLLVNYSYTLDLPDPGQLPPLDSFLFQNPRGHCEYFSTAMAILLRTIDIPTRSVNGFIGGRWNEAEQYLAVRNADAHSWIEVPFADYGWVRFDPTPPAANVSLQQNWLDPLRSFYDAMQFRWVKYVLQYDLDTQVELLQQITSTVTQMRSPDQKWGERLKTAWPELQAVLRQNLIPTLGIIFSTVVAGWQARRRRWQRLRFRDLISVVILSLLNVGLVYWLWTPSPQGLFLVSVGITPGLAFAWFRWSARVPHSPRRAEVLGISRFYLQLRQALAEAGVQIPKHQGPATLMEAVLAHPELPYSDRVLGMIQRYMQVRFGEEPLTAAELKTLWQDLRNLKKEWKHHRTPSSGPEPVELKAQQS
jgi:transglutaminase-like putative cysteine protease